ncbi:Nif3-like dinuclear metal center hexameric protein [Schaalia canis]|nr:Nif3-like dinuclear metal center hexameric protein [Schaalia canis]
MAEKWTVADVMALMERWYPASTAESWDKVGLILGDPARIVERIHLAVDPVSAVIDEAVNDGADMLITHHPLYLRGASFLPETDPKGSMVARLIRADIALFNAHTNADVAHDGVAHALADLVGLRDAEPLDHAGFDEDGRPIGLGRIGTVTPMSFGEFADLVASVLPAGPTGLLVGGDEHARIETVAVSGGAGDHFLDTARAKGADVYLTADLRHHPASEHLEGGAPYLLCASHWASEWPWLPRLASKLRTAAQEANVAISVEVSTIVTEPWTSYRQITPSRKTTSTPSGGLS